MVHFVIKCRELDTKKNYSLIEKDIRDPEERMRKLVYRDERHQEIGRQIKDLWSLRKELMKKLSIDPNKISQGTSVNPSLGGQATGPSLNSLQGGQVTGPILNPSQGGQVTGPSLNPLQGGQVPGHS